METCEPEPYNNMIKELFENCRFQAWAATKLSKRQLQKKIAEEVDRDMCNGETYAIYVTVATSHFIYLFVS